MKSLSLRSLVAYGTLVCISLVPLAPHAQQGAREWSMVTDHPVGTVAGDAVKFFAASLSRNTGGLLTGSVVSKTDAATPDLVAAVQQGRVQVADLFAGSLSELDPIFELPTLPFVVQSADEARRLACIAEPSYRRALSRAGLHLLFVSPWPPTGLWSRQPVATTSDVTSLKVRTYDQASAAVLRSIGARAAALPVKDIGPLLRIGGLDAVLSSGDGSVGEELGEDLANFSAIRYAYPSSFVVMREASFEALPETLQRQVSDAAAEAGRQQWASLPARIRANYVRMQHAGVVVSQSVDAPLKARLHEAGRAQVSQWLSRVPSEYANIIKTLQETETPSAEDRCSTSLLEAGNNARG